MKRIYTLAMAGLLAGAVSAQQAVNTMMTPPKPAPSKAAQFNKAKFLNKFNPSNQTMAGSQWVNYATARDQDLGGGVGQAGPAVLTSNYMNTDSMLYGDFGGTMSAIWIHHLGDILDITSPIYSSIYGTSWNAATSYSVDSASIVYAYTRKVNVVDTLIFTFFSNTGTNINGTSYFTGATASNYGTDTLSLRLMKVTAPTNTPTAAGGIVVKVPLTQADTAEVLYGEKYFALPSPYTIGAGKVMACAVTFKPGFTYALGDSADAKNAFYFASYEENGDGSPPGTGTFPTFFDCNFNSAGCDYNSSSIVPIDVRYGQAGGWNGYFIPSYAYTIGYGFEHHLISYRVTDPPVTINEVENNLFAMEQNAPNPFSTTTVIKYTLKNAAKSVKLEVTDFAGRVISTQVDNNLKPGTYNQIIEASKLAKGIYFYSLVIDGKKMTKKMIVE